MYAIMSSHRAPGHPHTHDHLPVSPAHFIPAYVFFREVFHSAVAAQRALTDSVSEVVDPSGMAVEPCSGGKVRSGKTYIQCHLRRANTHRACNGRGVEPDIVVEEGEREEGRDVFGWDGSFPWSNGPVRMVGMVMWGQSSLACHSSSAWRRLVERALRKQCSL